MKIEWNVWRAMLLSSVCMIFACFGLLYELVNDNFTVTHALLVFAWLPLWATLSIISKRTLKEWPK